MIYKTQLVSLISSAIIKVQFITIHEILLQCFWGVLRFVCVDILQSGARMSCFVDFRGFTASLRLRNELIQTLAIWSIIVIIVYQFLNSIKIVIFVNLADFVNPRRIDCVYKFVDLINFDFITVDFISCVEFNYINLYNFVSILSISSILSI